MTLIELLIVVVILTTLVAAAIPLLAPASDARRIREAARGLNTYITACQSRAIRLNRPVGIALKKLSSDTQNADDNGVCLEVFQVEQPPPFAGFDENGAIRVAEYFPSNSNTYGRVRPLYLLQFVTRGPNSTNIGGLPSGWVADTIPDTFLRPGDVVEVGGTRYALLADTTDGGIETRFGDPTNKFFASDTGKPGGNVDQATQIVAWPISGTGPTLNITHDDFAADLRDGVDTTKSVLRFFTYPTPYKILRQPMLTSTEPYQLPEGTAIDLRGSGDYEMFFHKPDGDPSQNQRVDNSEAVVIMFTPEGSVERVRMSLLPRQLNGNTFVDSPTTYNLFLLVGLRANVPVEDYDFSQPFTTQEALEEKKAQYNWLNLDSRWVMIGPQSGNVVTVENAFVRPEEVALLTSNYPTLPEKRDEEIRRAREFAREMTRTGGR